MNNNNFLLVDLIFLTITMMKMTLLLLLLKWMMN
ncbi:unnamed protein product [Schistosoma mattheei]|uniref:Uncharacterized protein n=1 Tax=Schistosoma mattheei TaxID=31246 RepID=A0A3P8DN21_9TREM|nr:unnamed protein product [Schistosoma mattheei]